MKAGEWCKKITDPKLVGASDVEVWFRALLDAGINFHPDTPAGEIGHYRDRRHGEWAPAFSEDEAKSMDKAMDRCFDLVIDPYEVGADLFEERIAA